MKIVYIAPQPIPSRAANSIHVMKMMQVFARLGHDAVLYFQKSGGRKEDIYGLYGVRPDFRLAPKINLPAPFGTVLYPLHNIFSLILEKPDLVLSRNLLTSWLAAKSGLNTLFEIHDSPDAFRPAALKIFRSFINCKNAAVIVISKALADHLQQDHRVPASKILHAPDAADPLPPVQKRPFEKIPGRFHAGYTGHLYKGRGIELIGEMTAALPDITFHIVGGTDSDIAYWRQKLHGLVNLHFHGHVPHARIGDYLQSFDALLAPYQASVAVTGNAGDTARWMSPLKIFEYMSAGKPILCSDLPVLREVLNDRNALLCPHDDSRAWIAALSDLQKNPNKCRALADAAQGDFLNHYTWAQRAEKILRFAVPHDR